MVTEVDQMANLIRLHSPCFLRLLSRPSPVTFAVRMTRPVTPLLYISHNQSELQELRKHVFIKEAHAGGFHVPAVSRRRMVM